MLSGIGGWHNYRDANRRTEELQNNRTAEAGFEKVSVGWLLSETGKKEKPDHSFRLFKVKKLRPGAVKNSSASARLQSNTPDQKEGTPAPAKKYLQPTTTTNGVNYQSCRICHFLHVVSRSTRKSVSPRCRGETYCYLKYYCHHSGCISR